MEFPASSTSPAEASLGAGPLASNLGGFPACLTPDGLLKQTSVRRLLKVRRCVLPTRARTRSATETNRTSFRRIRGLITLFKVRSFRVVTGRTLEDWERQAILAFHGRYPLDGCRRLVAEAGETLM
jgi:hypothetical protein